MELQTVRTKKHKRKDTGFPIRFKPSSAGFLEFLDPPHLLLEEALQNKKE